MRSGGKNQSGLGLRVDFAFFAPHQAYSSRQDPLGPVNEPFRDMVKARKRTA